MLDNGEYTCLTDDDVDENNGAVASNSKIEDKISPTKKDKFQTITWILYHIVSMMMTN